MGGLMLLGALLSSRLALPMVVLEEMLTSGGFFQVIFLARCDSIFLAFPLCLL
jgi:hypothetical protein